MDYQADLNTKKKPLYRRPRLYLVTILSLFVGFFLILILSVLALRWVNPSVTSFTYQENWDELETERYSLTEYWVSADEIPEHMMWAVIASEDQLFYEHQGFDVESIREAWDERKEGERVRGASTISQQVAKNLFLSPAQSMVRKGVEAGFTVLIELFWPKERIMEVYLNIAEFGPGVFGIGKAAETFYGIPAESLDPEMSTRLAAVLPSPKRMQVNPPSPYAEERSAWILRQMTHLSGIAYYQPDPPDPDELGTLHGQVTYSTFLPDSLTRISRDLEDEYNINQLDSLIYALEEPELPADTTNSLQPEAADSLQVDHQDF